MTCETKEEFVVLAFYTFTSIAESDLDHTAEWLQQFGKNCGLGGLAILAMEGVNATVAGKKEGIDLFQGGMQKRFNIQPEDFKYARAEKDPFKRFKVKIRSEIVTTGVSQPPVVEGGLRASHLSPAQWHERISSKSDICLLDTRNWYETDLGIFQGAEDPRLVNFQEFEEYVKQSDIPKDKEVYMYCTGGIRCEKASLVMENLGYEKVFQLRGGILKYLEEHPDGLFDGECFVFDQRVAVDKELRPTQQYSLCPHSGQPASEWISCLQCGKEARVSIQCLEQESLRTCSKHCANLFESESKSVA